jgi:hypothetical protein
LIRFDTHRTKPHLEGKNMKENQTAPASDRPGGRRSERGAAAVVAKYIQELSGESGGRRRPLPVQGARDLSA